MELFVYRVLIDDVERHLLSPIKSDVGLKNGLNGKSVIGYLRNPAVGISKDNVTINQDFLKVFQDTIKSTASTSEGLLKQARQQKTGYMYVIDQRAINKPDTKPHDIIGAFQVKNGQIILDSYEANKTYELISVDGLFKLPADLEQNILKAISN